MPYEQAGRYRIRAGKAGKKAKRARTSRFADANFNVKFRLKSGFDLDKFELAADGSDGRRGYFINGPGESRVLDFAHSEADGFARSEAGEFARGEASKSMCEEADKFKQDKRVRYFATKPVLARKFRQKARNFRRRYGCFLLSFEHKMQGGAKKDAVCRAKFSTRRAVVAMKRRAIRGPHTRTCRALVGNAYDRGREANFDPL